MAIPTYHATAADVESEQTLLTKAPAHPWKRLAAGAAVASFVLGCLAATAVNSAPGLRGADLHSSTPLPGDQISLKGRNSKWCLAVEDHNNVHEGTKLQLYECSHPVGQTFQVEKNKDGSMNLRYGNTDFCVDALGGTKFTNHGSYFGLYPCRTNGFNQELTHTKIGTLELTEFPGNLCMTVKNGLLAEGSHIVGAPCTGHGGLLDQFQLWDIEGSTPAPAPTPSTNTCNKPCTSNRDCATGGYLECGQCNLQSGTFGFGTCMAAPTSPPTDAPPNPCGKPCTEDKDCNGNGGFFGNTCLVGGTRCAGHCAKRD